MRPERSSLPPFDGWRHARPPVATGPLADVVTLRELGDGRALTEGTGTDDLLHPVHVACRVVTDVILRAWLFDGAQLLPEPGQLGVVTADGGGTVGVWAGELTTTELAPQAFGHRCIEAIEPIVRSAARSIGRSPRTVRRIAAENLHTRAHGLRLRGAEPTPDATVEAFGVGLGVDVGRRRCIAVGPDTGPPIEVLLPSVCCVLRRSPDIDSCPTCPSHVDDGVRRRATTEWLRSLEVDEFLDVTGRCRHR